MRYKKLEIWQLARELSLDIHKMTLNNLPKFEMFEEGNQIRKSSQSTRSTIVEEYGRRRYKQEFIRYLVYAVGSNDETSDHLDTLYETESLKDQKCYPDLSKRLDKLGRKLNLFIKSVGKGHISKK